MSNTATLQLEVSSSDLDYLDATSIPFVFDEASSLDLLEYAMETLNIPNEYTFVIKCKTVDFFGQPKIAILTRASSVVDGQLYYLFISAKEETPGTKGHLVPRTSTPNAPQRTLRTPDSYDLSQSSTFRMLNFGTPMRRMQRPFAMEEQSSVQPQIASESADMSMDTPSPSVVEEPRSEDVTHPSELENADQIALSNASPCSTLFHRISPLDRGNRPRFLGELYDRNKLLMDEKFAEMQPDEPFIFHDVNSTEMMSVPRNKTSMVILRNIGLADYDIRVGTIAREMAQKFFVDIIMDVRKTMRVNKDLVQPLASFLDELTESTFFTSLLRPGGPVFEAIRKRESREEEKKGFLPRKKTKLMFTVEQLQDIEQAAKAAAAAHTQEEVEVILQNSSPARCLWIANMVQKDASLIPETVVAKFPMFKTNGTWLLYDFRYTMENVYKMPVFNISEQLQKYAPAIAALALNRGIITQSDRGIIENDLMRIAEVLVDLIGLYLKRKNPATAGRLILKSQELPSLGEMITQRKTIKLIAPMIFVVETAQGNQYYVSTDDFALHVPGNFGNALHCLAALHYVLYIEYAKELLNFNLFLENLCGLNMKKMNQTRQNLLFDLDCQLRTLAHQNQSNAQ